MSKGLAKIHSDPKFSARKRQRRSLIVIHEDNFAGFEFRNNVDYLPRPNYPFTPILSPVILPLVTVFIRKKELPKLTRGLATYSTHWSSIGDISPSEGGIKEGLRVRSSTHNKMHKDKMHKMASSNFGFKVLAMTP